MLHVKGFKQNLLSISQFCDEGNKATFDSNYCIVENQNDKQIKLIGKRINNIYMIDLEDKTCINSKCLITVNNDSRIWHKRFAHASMNLIDKLSKNDLVIRLPRLKYVKDKIYDACQRGK